MAEWKALGDAVSIRGVHHSGFAEASAAFRILGLQQVAAPGARA
jgi:hypothetical protein